jgi:hypothetical protein
VASVRCFRCNCFGHLAVDCRTARANFKQRPLETLAGSCRKCGVFGHYEGACRQHSASGPRDGPPLTAFPFPPGGVGTQDFEEAKAAAATLRDRFRRDKAAAETHLADTSRAIGRQEFVVAALSARGGIEQDEGLSRAKLVEAALFVATRLAETTPGAETFSENFRRRTRSDLHQCPFCFLGFAAATLREHVARDHFGPPRAATQDREAKQRQAIEASSDVFFSRLLVVFVCVSREKAARQKHTADEGRARTKIAERMLAEGNRKPPAPMLDDGALPGFEPGAAGHKPSTTTQTTSTQPNEQPAASSQQTQSQSAQSPRPLYLRPPAGKTRTPRETLPTNLRQGRGQRNTAPPGAARTRRRRGASARTRRRRGDDGANAGSHFAARHAGDVAHSPRSGGSSGGCHP